MGVNTKKKKKKLYLFAVTSCCILVSTREHVPSSVHMFLEHLPYWQLIELACFYFVCIPPNKLILQHKTDDGAFHKF